MAKADLAAEPAVLSRAEYVRAATSAKPVAPLGQRFTYSNAMYSAVGEILAAVHRSTWEQVIATEIFGPLGMTASRPTLTDLTTLPDHATGHVHLAGDTWRAVPSPRSLGALGPGGSIAASARDMTRWLAMLAEGGRIGGRRFVSEAMFDELTRPHSPIDDSKFYGLGWATYDWAGIRVVEHNGGSAGISALVSFIPERRIGFVFLANTSPTAMTAIGNAADLVYPILLDRRAPTRPPKAAPPPSPPAPAPADLPGVDALLARMIRADGGARTLRRHASYELHGRKSYDNQGITAALTIRARAPAMRSEEEIWSAAGRQIARIRIYFDGARGGQETTLGQDALLDDEQAAQARRTHDFHPLLHLRQLYPEVHVTTRSKLGDSEVLALELRPTRGEPVRLFVSTATHLVVGRETAGETATFSDHRRVDGELVPFRIVAHDALGEATTIVDDIRFDVPIPDAAFAAATPSPLRRPRHRQLRR